MVEAIERHAVRHTVDNGASAMGKSYRAVLYLKVIGRIAIPMDTGRGGGCIHHSQIRRTGTSGNIVNLNVVNIHITCCSTTCESNIMSIAGIISQRHFEHLPSAGGRRQNC